ncbi:MAG: metallophosphoesterase [Clostridia bacterium]|nr:metallophosphoesterase [Clostridia bacterium]
MRVFAIGDLHLDSAVDKPMDVFGPGWEDHFVRICNSWQAKVKDDDLVLIPGDISWGMRSCEAQPDLDLIAALPGKKIIIRGNHDYWWDSISRVRSMLKGEFFALQNDAIKINNVVICGTRGWTVPNSPAEFKDDDKRIYDREVIRMQLALEDMAKKRQDGDISIVMIHYPPFNVKIDSSDFTDLFEKYKVDIVVYGHLHGKNCRACKFVQKNGIKYYLTSCDQVNCELVDIL